MDIVSASHGIADRRSVAAATGARFIAINNCLAIELFFFCS
jgi:hypothetical protein